MTNTCYQQLTTFFVKEHLSTQIDTTTSFGTFYLTFINSKGATISTSCLENLDPKSYLFIKMRDESFLPQKQVKVLGSVNYSLGSSNVRFLISVPIQDDDNHVSCSEDESADWQPVSYTVYICKFTVIFSF